MSNATDALEDRLRRRSNIRFTVILVLVLLVAAWTVLVTVTDADYEHRDHETGRQCQEDEYADHNGRCVHLDAIKATLSAPELYEAAYIEQLHHVPPAADWPDQWAIDFADDVCAALESWGAGDGRYVASLLVEQWDWTEDDALLAVSSATRYACPNYEPSTWGTP